MWGWFVFLTRNTRFKRYESYVCIGKSLPPPNPQPPYVTACRHPLLTVSAPTHCPLAWLNDLGNAPGSGLPRLFCPSPPPPAAVCLQSPSYQFLKSRCLFPRARLHSISSARVHLARPRRTGFSWSHSLVVVKKAVVVPALLPRLLLLYFACGHIYFQISYNVKE